MADVDTGDSVTMWIESLKAGDADAAAKLWRRYFEAMVRLCQADSAWRRGPWPTRRMRPSTPSTASSAARCGPYPRLDDRDDLWRLLVIITERKALDQAQHERREKRGGGRVIGMTSPGDAVHPGGGTALIADAMPTPEFAAMIADECRNLLGKLRDDSLRQVALLRMEGYTNEEVADRLGCSLRTIARKIELIRRTWTGEEATAP